MVTYLPGERTEQDGAGGQADMPLLGFPWTVTDILVEVKRAAGGSGGGGGAAGGDDAGDEE